MELVQRLRPLEDRFVSYWKDDEMFDVVEPKAVKGQRKFHRFMNEMTVEQVAVYPGAQLPEMGPTKAIIELVDKKKRHYFVPVESLQRGTVEPPDGSTVTLTNGRVAQRIDSMGVNNSRWFTIGSQQSWTWEVVQRNVAKG